MAPFDTVCIAEQLNQRHLVVMANVLFMMKTNTCIAHDDSHKILRLRRKLDETSLDGSREYDVGCRAALRTHRLAAIKHGCPYSMHTLYLQRASHLIVTVIIAASKNRACGFFCLLLLLLFLLPFFRHLISAVTDWMSTMLAHMMWP